MSLVNACGWLLALLSFASLFVPATSQGTNQSPVLTLSGQQSVVSVEETRYTGTELLQMKCEDPEDDVTRAYLSSLSPSFPCGQCFAVRPCSPPPSTKTDFCLYFIPGQGQLKYSTTPSYVAQVTCTDDVNEDQAIIDIRVIDNQAPVFEGLGVFNDFTSLSTDTKREGDEIYDVDATDEEGDAIFYRMTSDPDVGLFEIGYADGKIRASKDLRLLCGDQAIRMPVTIADRYHDPVGPAIINVNFRGTNIAPVFDNTQRVVEIAEDPDHKTAAINKVVLDLKVTDDTVYDSLRFKMRAEPERGMEYYHLVEQNGRMKVRTRKRLDYEYADLRSVRLYFDVMDGFCQAEVYSVLVEITDVNELPEITPDYVERTVYEGFIEIDPGWKATDPDENENLQWSIVRGGGGAFDVNPVSGSILSTGEFDVDPNTPEKVRTLTVKVTDKDNEEAEASIKLTVLDKNDNVPVFVSRLVKVSANECTKVGALIGKVLARDDDSEFQGNNQLVYSGQGTMIWVLATGDITLTQPCKAGQTESIEAHVTDQGTYPGPLEGVPTTVSFTCNVCPDPVDPATTVAVPGIEDYGNDADSLALLLSWLIPAAFLGLLLLALLSYLIWRACRRCCDRPSKTSGRRKKKEKSPKAQPQQPKPEAEMVEVVQLSPPEPPPPEKDPVLFGFWKETYVDRDQRHMPQRDVQPISVAKDQEVEAREKVEEEIEKEERRQERQKVEENYRQELEKYQQEVAALRNPPPVPQPKKESSSCLIL